MKLSVDHLIGYTTILFAITNIVYIVVRINVVNVWKRWKRCKRSLERL